MSLLVSAVIPCYNEEEAIEACIKSLLSQTYKPLEILIVDDGSTDKTREIIKKYRKVKLIEGQHKGAGASRNLGAQHAKGKILIFTDADMVLDKDYVKEIIKPLISGRERVGCEERYQMASNPENVWSKCWGQYAKEMPANEGRVFRAIWRDKFFELGPFDTSLGYADDLTIHLKHGLHSTLVNKAICYHKNPETLGEVYKQSVWIGSSFNNPILKLWLFSWAFPIALILAAPIFIPVLIIRQLQKVSKWFDGQGLFLPMCAFITVRYTGTAMGLAKRIYLGKNTR